MVRSIFISTVYSDLFILAQLEVECQMEDTMVEVTKDAHRPHKTMVMPRALINLGFFHKPLLETVCKKHFSQAIVGDRLYSAILSTLSFSSLELLVWSLVVCQFVSCQSVSLSDCLPVCLPFCLPVCQSSLTVFHYLMLFSSIVAYYIWKPYERF